MPLINFRFVPTAPEALSGASALDQIERAFNELGEEISSSTETANQALHLAEQAVAIAGEAVATASEAVGIANSANSSADSAVATANGAKTIADTAFARANAAYDMAATADTNAQVALVTAQNALTDAQGAKNSADTALQAATDALAIAQSSNERVMDLEKKALYFTGVYEDTDLNTLIYENKIYFNGKSPLANTPADHTSGYLEIYPSDGDPGTVLQRFTAPDGASVYTRTGVVTEDGESADFIEWHVPASGSAGDYPLLEVLWSVSALEKFGYFRADLDHGLIDRAAFPHAAAEVQRRFMAGDVYVVTEEAWQEDFSANGGATMLFSIGDGATSFRLPVLGKGMAPSAPWPEMGLKAGNFVEDRMRAIEGEITRNTSGFPFGFSDVHGSFTLGEPTTDRAATQAGTAYAIKFDSSLLGLNYSGPITHGPRGVMVPYIKMYGTVTEASEANIAALIEETASLNASVEQLIGRSGSYELCEFYFFRHPTLRPGFQPAQGGLIQNAATLYPDAWAYLQTTEGRMLCKTEAEWQAMVAAAWATLAGGTTVGWNGIGGAPFYAPNLETGALRLPDLRGMYAEAAGFDSLEVGGVHGDGMRKVLGKFSPGCHIPGASGVFTSAHTSHNEGANSNNGHTITFDSSRVVPTSNKNQPRAFGVLPCVYLGASA